MGSVRPGRLLLCAVLACAAVACGTTPPVPPAPLAATSRPTSPPTRASRPTAARVLTTPRASVARACPTAGRSTLEVAGRPVLLGVPVGAARPPLVLALAGYDQTRQDLDRVSHLVGRARAHGVEVALLQGRGTTPAWGYQPGETADVAFARQVLAVLLPCADASRLVLLGFSDGGLMAMRIGCALGRRVRDLVLLSASVAPEAGCRLPADVRAVHGTDDPFDPYDGNDRGIPPARSAIAAWGAAAGCARLTETTTARGVGVRSYPPCPVSLTTLEGGGHTWPGGEPSANPHAGPVFPGYDLTGLLLRLAAA